MDEVPLAFLENAYQNYPYGELLFPRWFRPVLRRCNGVNERFEGLYNSFMSIKPKKQRQLLNIIRSARFVKRTCNETQWQPLSSSDIEPMELRKALKELYEFLFEKTISTNAFRAATGMSIKDHYDKFLTANNIDVCPFCGLETYALPEMRRADYDHYLPISEYPWLGVNFDNLVPMGDTCNSKKNAAQLLYSNPADRHSRRLVWYPYDFYLYALTANTTTRATLGNPLASWQVQITTTDVDTAERLNTWNSVFNIQNNLATAITRRQKSFIEDLCLKNNIYGQNLTNQQLRSELQVYVERGSGSLTQIPLAIVKKAWASYYIHRATDPELEPIKSKIRSLAPRPPLISIN